MIDRSQIIDRRIVLEANLLRSKGHRVILIAKQGLPGQNQREIDGLPILRIDEMGAGGPDASALKFEEVGGSEFQAQSSLEDALSLVRDQHSQKRLQAARGIFESLLGRKAGRIVASVFAPRCSVWQITENNQVPPLLKALAVLGFGILALDGEILRKLPSVLRGKKGGKRSLNPIDHAAKIQFQLSRRRAEALPASRGRLAEYWRRLLYPRYGLDQLRIGNHPLRIVPGIVLALLTFDPYIIRKLGAFARGRFPFLPAVAPDLRRLPDGLPGYFHGHPPDSWEEAVLKLACALDRVDVVHAHDLPALRTAVLVGKRRKIPVVYDAHELFSYQPGVQGETRRELLNTERELIGHCQKIVVINSDQAAVMQRDHGPGNYVVLTNATEQPSGFDIRRRYSLVWDYLGLPNETPTMLFMGGVNRARKIHQLLEGAALSAHPVHLIFLTWGREIEDFKELAEELEIADRVHFVDPVSWSEVVYWAASVDVGVMPYQPVDMNTRISSPNKMYEFIAAGTPMIGSSELVNVRRVVEAEGFGVLLPFCKAADYAQAIDAIFDPALGGPARFRPALIEKARKYLWEEQARDFSRMYDQLLAEPEGSR